MKSEKPLINPRAALATSKSQSAVTAVNTVPHAAGKKDCPETAFREVA